jgi:hypothetical protein
MIHRAGINEIFDRSFVLAAHAHHLRMSSVEFCSLTKMARMSGHYYCQLVTDTIILITSCNDDTTETRRHGDTQQWSSFSRNTVLAGASARLDTSH